MTATFFGLEIGYRALNAQQIALDVTGHNISNASSPTYSRQTANMVVPTPYTTLGYGRQLSLGTGVEVGSITRARSAFIDSQYRSQYSLQQYWTQKQSALQNVEGIVNEPSDNSLHGDMDALWSAFGSLATDPENAGARTVVQERAVALSEGFHQIVTQINSLKNDSENSITVGVNQVNDIAKQISQLNTQIKTAEVNGDNPNDLCDQRDALVDQLSQYFSVTVNESQDPNFTDRVVNNYSVKIGDHYLVQANSAYDTINVSGDPPTLQWNSDSTAVKAGDGSNGDTGSIKASLDNLTYLGKLEGKYDQLAQAVHDAVNQLHQAGYDLYGNLGGDFFDYSDPANPGASTLELAANIQNDPSLIAAASSNSTVAGTNTSADGGNALQIASLKDGWDSIKSLSSFAGFQTSYPDVSSATSFSDYYGSVISGIGVDSQEADRMVSSYGVLVTQSSNQRQSFSGVSLDEEMTNMIQFQKSYTAAARIITTMDDMLNTIVNGMGITR